MATQLCVETRSVRHYEDARTRSHGLHCTSSHRLNDISLNQFVSLLLKAARKALHAITNLNFFSF